MLIFLPLSVSSAAPGGLGRCDLFGCAIRQEAKSNATTDSCRMRIDNLLERRKTENCTVLIDRASALDQSSRRIASECLIVRTSREAAFRIKTSTTFHAEDIGNDAQAD